MDAMIISGSRNPEGQTARAVNAVRVGIENAGKQCKTVFLPTLAIQRCRQCDNDGWGLCRRAGRCLIDDDFAGLADELRKAEAVVFATPVYYSDLSESLRAFLDRLRRTCFNEAGRPGIHSKQAMGICVAGGGGGGAPACCVSLEKILTTSGFNVVDMLPVRRQNLEAKLTVLEQTGTVLATPIHS